MNDYYDVDADSDDNLPLFSVAGNTAPRFELDELKAGTQAANVASVLADGEWHTTNELLEVCSHRFATGIQALRLRGFEIHTRDDGDTFIYRLVKKHDVEKASESLQSAYYRHPHWIHMRTLRIEHDGGRCVNCHATENLEVHHWVYDLFAERLGDLMTMCRKCHRRIHDTPNVRVGFPKSITTHEADRIRTKQ